MTETPDVQPSPLPWHGTARGALALAGLAGLALLAFASWAGRSAASARARAERLASDIARGLDGDALARAGAAVEHEPEAALAPGDGLAREREGVALRVLRLEARAQPRVGTARSAEAAEVLEVLASSAGQEGAQRADYAPAMAPAFFERAASSTRHGG